MKTKIIYISGNEVFEMSQIRAAFDTVRAALGLDKDTILFGVPVDSESALDVPVPAVESGVPVAERATEPVVEAVVEPVVADAPIDVVEPVAEPIVDVVAEITPVDEPVVTDVPEIAAEMVTEQLDPELDAVLDEPVDDTPATATDDADVADVADAVIPILSILAPHDDDVAVVADSESDSVSVDVIADAVVTDVEMPTDDAETVVISDINIDTELSAPVAHDDDTVEKITIGDMIVDDAPTAPVERTLEQLLESMAPLREDIEPDVSSDVVETNVAPVLDVADDTDATLAQLASEFAETADKIVPGPKTEPTGKIGKLKNILPFKKAKRDDSSLMGDLFGWAGIAANDEDFTIPGFFANAKKQGA